MQPWEGFSHPQESRITGGFDEMVGAHKGQEDWDPLIHGEESVWSGWSSKSIISMKVKTKVLLRLNAAEFMQPQTLAFGEVPIGLTLPIQWGLNDNCEQAVLFWYDIYLCLSETTPKKNPKMSLL